MENNNHHNLLQKTGKRLSFSLWMEKKKRNPILRNAQGAPGQQSWSFNSCGGFVPDNTVTKDAVL